MRCVHPSRRLLRKLLRGCEPLAGLAFDCTEFNIVIPLRKDSLAETVMAGLFDDFPETPFVARSKVAGEARMREPVRDQIELRAVDLDSLIGADHPARAFWALVQRLDLRDLEDAIKAREHTPGQAPPHPPLPVELLA